MTLRQNNTSVLPESDPAMRPAIERRTAALDRMLEPMRRVANLPLSNMVALSEQQTPYAADTVFVPVAASVNTDRAALRCALAGANLRDNIRQDDPSAFVAPPVYPVT